MTMVVSHVFGKHQQQQCQNRLQRSPQTTTTVLLKRSTSHASNARNSPAQQQRKSPQYRKSQKLGSIASVATLQPANTGNVVSGQLSIETCNNNQMHQSASDSCLSSSQSAHLSYHHEADGGGGSDHIPIALPLDDLGAGDISKKRRRRHVWFSSYWNSTPRHHRVLHAVLLVVAIWYTILQTRRIIRRFQGEQLPPPQKLDFLIAGFPKSGTTTLLATLRDHPQIAMDSEENCQIARPIQQDDVNLKRLNRYLFALKNDIVKERKQERAPLLRFLPEHLVQATDPPLVPQNLLSGIKCPDAVKNFKAIHRLSQYSPDCKFVVGVRHPILFLQSFYNYRVVEAHLKNRPDIPSLFHIWRKNQNWWDVSPDAPRFEMFLSQFGKTGVSLEQLKEWFVERPMLAVKPNRFRIFLYSLEQLEDPSQSVIFRRDLQNFLGLYEEVKPFGHENRIPDHIEQYKETIDICSPDFNSIRQDVLNHAAATVEWMYEFLKSPDVVVSNRSLLLKHIQTWTQDPCEDANVMAG